MPANGRWDLIRRLKVKATKDLRCFAQSPIHVTSRRVPTAMRNNGGSVHNMKSHIVVQPVASSKPDSHTVSPQHKLATIPLLYFGSFAG